MTMSKGKNKTDDQEPPVLEDVDFSAQFSKVEGYRIARAQQIFAYDDTGFDLTVEEQLFVRSYMIDRNEIAALRRLNYTENLPRLKNIAKRMLSNTEVQGAIEFLARRMMEQLEITAEKVQRRIAEVAFFDPRSVMSFDEAGVNFINSRFWTEAQARNIQSVKQGKDGIEVKFYDGLKAAEMLAKQLQLQPSDDQASVDAAAKAGANEVFDKILDLFDKMVEPTVKTKEIEYKGGAVH